MDRETRIAPASGVDPPDHPDSGLEPRPDGKPPGPPGPPGLPSRPPGRPEPPGFDAIRDSTDHPSSRGVGGWLFAIGHAIWAACKWLYKNADPIARGIEKAGNTVARVSRGAVKVGHAAGEIGGKLSEWGRDRRDAGGARLRRIGQGLRHFGSRATRIGTQAEDVAESVEDLGEELVSITGAEDGKKRAALASTPESRKTRPSASRRLKPPARPTQVPAPRATPPPGPAPEAAALAQGDPNGEFPEAFRERIRALGKRRRSKPLRQLILDICTFREWTTVGELAEWLGTDASNLQKRHLRPLLKSGQLRLRYPENKSHPEQGYHAAGA